MKKVETLKDGKTITIRELTADDLNRLMDFYHALPLDDRKYLRVDVTNREVVAERLKHQVESGHAFRLAALDGDTIIADGALELSEETWRRHQGELRLIVSHPFQRKGLGTVMMKELYLLAIEKNIPKIVVQIMRPQAAARAICRRLGFHEELMIPDYVRDQSGETQDLIIMTADTKELMKELDSLYNDSDWQRCR